MQPPFRARQWFNWTGDNQTMTLVSQRGYSTRWNLGRALLLGNPPVFGVGESFPEGMRGELTYLHFTCIDDDLSTTAIFELGLTVRLNAGIVPGYFQLPGAGFVDRPDAVFGTTRSMLHQASSRVLAPIHLVPGDRLDIEIATFNAILDTYTISAAWGGWMYPLLVEGEAGSIRATQQDPGMRQPLAG